MKHDGSNKKSNDNNFVACLIIIMTSQGTWQVSGAVMRMIVNCKVAARQTNSSLSFHLEKVNCTLNSSCGGEADEKRGGRQGKAVFDHIYHFILYRIGLWHELMLVTDVIKDKATYIVVPVTRNVARLKCYPILMLKFPSIASHRTF